MFNIFEIGPCCKHLKLLQRFEIFKCFQIFSLELNDRSQDVCMNLELELSRNLKAGLVPPRWGNLTFDPAMLHNPDKEIKFYKKDSFTSCNSNMKKSSTGTLDFFFCSYSIHISFLFRFFVAIVNINSRLLFYFQT